MSFDQDCTIYLLSNACTDEYPNTLSKFINNLPRVIEAKKENYEIALTGFGIHLNFTTLFVPHNFPLFAIAGPHAIRNYENYLNSGRKKKHLIDFIPSSLKFKSDGDRYNTVKLLQEIKKFMFKKGFKRKLKFERNQDKGAVSIVNISPTNFTLIIHTQLWSLLCFPDSLPDFVINYNFIRGEKYVLIRIKPDQTLEGEPLPYYSEKSHPSLINITSNVVDLYQTDNHHSRILYTSYVPRLSSVSYHYYIPPNPRYFNISYDNITKISINLQDENFKQLPLNEGHASFIKLHLRKKKSMNSEINLRLSSKKTELHNENTTSKFAISLSNPISLPANAKIAMASILFPNKIANLTQKMSKSQIKFIPLPHELEGDSPFATSDAMLPNRPLKEISVSLKAKHYRSNRDFVSYLNNQFYSIFKSMRIEYLTFTYEDHYLFIRFSLPCKLKIPYTFSKIFGINKQSTDEYFEVEGKKNSTYVFSNPMNINEYYPNYILCYTNIVQPTIMGSIYTNIFKVFPTKPNTKDRYSSIEFDNLDFIKLNSHVLDTIHFEMRAHDGELINFVENENIVMHLVIKK